jgi:DNA (cytosine-5)-methyltransferase 1
MILNYDWTLKDAIFTKDQGKVFSCFACGGGSTMGYKLAGFDVLGCNEIDKKMIEVYKANHHPKYFFNEPIQTFKLRDDLPNDLYNLDILDGSPPCSSFSMSGNREKDWGKEKVFAEGQALQVLDTLFFDFIDLANKLKPKIIIAENVKGILQGNARQYTRKIIREFNIIGYKVVLYLLNSNTMGVPQSRERVFFIAIKNELYKKVKPLILEFNQSQIPYKLIKDEKGKEITDYLKSIWINRQYRDNKLSDTLKRMGKKQNLFTWSYIYDTKVVNTLDTNSNKILYNKPIFLSDTELTKIGAFPSDYNFNGRDKKFIIGMSVPPLMIAQIANQVNIQWLSKI